MPVEAAADAIFQREREREGERERETALQHTVDRQSECSRFCAEHFLATACILGVLCM